MDPDQDQGPSDEEYYAQLGRENDAAGVNDEAAPPPQNAGPYSGPVISNQSGGEEQRPRGPSSQRFELRSGHDLSQGGGWEPLSQADYMRMQRMNQGLASIDQQRDDGEITDEMHRDLRFELRNNLQPLQYRATMQQQQMRQEQITSLQNSNATMAGTQARDLAFHSLGNTERTWYAYDPEIRAQVMGEISREDFPNGAAGDEMHKNAVNEETRSRGGAQLMYQATANSAVPINMPGSQAGGTSGGTRSGTSGGTRAGSGMIDRTALRKIAAAEVKQGSPELTGRAFLDEVSRHTDTLVAAERAHQESQRPPTPEAPLPREGTWQHNRAMRTGIEATNTTITDRAQRDPAFREATADYHEQITTASPDWERVAAALDAMPAEMRRMLPMNPTLKAKIDAGRARAAMNQPGRSQGATGQGTPGTMQQAVPMATPNPAMSTLGNMMNRGAAAPTSEPALTPADQEPTMHSLISDLESSRQSLGSPAALTPLQRNFPNSTMFGTREAHRAHAQHQQVAESYNAVIRTIREGDGDLTEAQKRTISEKMPSLPAPIQQRLRQYLANPRRGERRPGLQDAASQSLYRRLGI